MWHNQAILYEFEFYLNGNLRELERLTAEIERFCAAHALGDEVMFDLNLAIEELFVNSVRHGGCDGMENAARVRLRRARGVEVEYRDRGRPFNPTLADVPDIHAPLEERKDGGLGIHLVRQTMRELEYRRVDDWNEITMKHKDEASGTL